MSATVFIFSVCGTAVLLFLSVYYIVNLSDLECDHINASICCRRLSNAVIPEAILCSLMSIMLVYYGYFSHLTFTVPMVIWLIYRICMKPRGNISFYDPTEILNRQQLKTFINEAIVKLMYHLVAFFIFLYSMIMTILSGMDETNMDDLPKYKPFDEV